LESSGAGEDGGEPAGDLTNAAGGLSADAMLVKVVVAWAPAAAAAAAVVVVYCVSRADVASAGGTKCRVIVRQTSKHGMLIMSLRADACVYQER
jgi:hypothetical protein